MDKSSTSKTRPVSDEDTLMSPEKRTNDSTKSYSQVREEKSQQTSQTQATKTTPGKKTIIILGKTGAGKFAISQNIFQDDFKKPTLKSLDSVTREPSLKAHDGLHILNGISFRVRIIDTNGVKTPSHHTEEIVKSVEDLGPVNTIFFVLKYGRVTSNDCLPLHAIIDALQATKYPRENCYLLVTGCEDLDKAGLEGVVEMYKQDPLTEPICSFVQLKILTVGFPDLNAMIPQLRPLYQKTIESYKMQVQKIICNSTSSCPIQIPKEFKFKLPSPQDEAKDKNEICTVM